MFRAAVCGCLGALLPTTAQQLKGDVQAVYDLIDRILPGSKDHFKLSIQEACGSDGDNGCFELADEGDHLSIVASGANELAYGLGSYLREDCNMSIGWPRGGGSNVFIPKAWPKVGDRTVRHRTAPWSYFMNVCTHSYSLVWYGWEEWEAFIDWMALSGINNVLAMTGQEEVQYKVFRQFGLSDREIRSWFNGPALLTWSRGQNEYGSDIAGPLPRSWMKDQWDLQRRILPRYRSLGIVGQLPGFQGNVPVALKNLTQDANMTNNKKGTAWLDSLDPLFGQIADAWMKTLIDDFGTDHWYQLDGYFDGDTAPWLSTQAPEACVFSDELVAKYVAGCSLACRAFGSRQEAQRACAEEQSCGGITQTSKGYELRSGVQALESPSQESSWLITNVASCHPPQPVLPDPTWMRRGAAAYMGLNRTDAEAIWSFQGWAFVGWQSQEQGSHLRGFIEATPPGKFVIIDMSVNGEGEWKKWQNSSFWGAKFIWTTLHDFGGTDGMKGNLAQVNRIPFDGMGDTASSVWGTGFTPEGIDQNPVYYEFVIDQNWRTAPVENLTNYVVSRAHRRYNLKEMHDAVAASWALLTESAYAQDLSVQDRSGVKNFPGAASQFQDDRWTPTPTLCKIFRAWDVLVSVGAGGDDFVDTAPFRYDLVNLGRELLAQVTTPASMNFSDAIKASSLDMDLIVTTGDTWTSILKDMDTLVATEPAFLLGPWIHSARALGKNASGDCVADGFEVGPNCADFYEWNARVQLTTWNPTVKDASHVPSGPVDYAGKHWSGLLEDYYAARVHLVQQQAQRDAAAGRNLDTAAVEQLKAGLAYNWTMSKEAYPDQPVGDALEVSQRMLEKYTRFYMPCVQHKATKTISV